MRSVLIGSLFSGIGGLELGVLLALTEAGIPARVVWQVEIDSFCRSVLARHFPETDRSVTDVRAALSLSCVDLIVGGFPCQDVSVAGKGDGLSGERSGLWWAYRDVVRALRPPAVLVENVASGLRRWHGPVRCSLEAMGYRTWARQISAADIGAPHRRERVFVLAHTERMQLRLESGRSEWSCRAGAPEPGNAGKVAHAASERWNEGQWRERKEGRGATVDYMRQVGDPERARREGEKRSCSGGVGSAARSTCDPNRTEPETLGGMGGSHDGLPVGVDLPSRWPAGRSEEQYAWEPPRTVTGREPHRRARLKALGNAVVPAQGREAMRWALDLVMFT